MVPDKLSPAAPVKLAAGVLVGGIIVFAILHWFILIAAFGIGYAIRMIQGWLHTES